MKPLYKFIRLFVIAFALSVALALSASAASEGGGTITATSLNFRSEASISSDCIGSAPQGSAVIVTGKTEDWYSVIYNGMTGYMFASYVETNDAMELPEQNGKITGDAVRFRESPSYTGKVLTYLNTNFDVKVVGVNGEWYKAEYKGDTGYIHSDYVNLLSQKNKLAVVPADMEVGASAVALAKTFLGTKYVYGGSSPSGFDCSGFTSYIYKNLGYDISRTCTSQYAQYPHLERDELQIGDLVFFANAGIWDTDHVGIYLGDGDFIHASSGGGKVMISSFLSGYYDKYYYGAARVTK
jgi:cell wall-associated NlpC family hydrolase